MRSVALWVVCLSAVPASAFAQDDQAAGLFTKARQLPLISQSLSVRAASGEAELVLTQVFTNDGEDLAQADYHLYLPEGASVAGFAFWQGDKRLAAELKTKEEAEAAHKAAAAEGRATAILKKEGSIHSFSVYPVKAGELKRVETTIRMPVVRESGRSGLRLPVDAFLGQTGASSTVFVDLTSDDALADLGVEGEKPVTIARAGKGAKLAFATKKPVELWWREQGPALVTDAESVVLPDGSRAIGVRVVLNDAKSWSTSYARMHWVIDGSFSMRRRAQAVAWLLERAKERAGAPLSVSVVASRSVSFGPSAPAEAIADALRSGAAGHKATVAGLSAELAAMGCKSAEVRCVVVTDPQVGDLDVLAREEITTVFIADPHELAFSEGKLPAASLVYQMEADPRGKLEAIADELTLPVLDVVSVVAAGAPLELPAKQARRTAEGGMLRLFGTGPGAAAAVEIAVSIDGRKVVREVTPRELDSSSEDGRRLRRGYYQKLLAHWMAAYKEKPDEAQKKRIIEVSLAEQIPTAFTALQVSDPELSLAAIKPGDPLITVRDEPGLVSVTAYYPFGEVRAMVKDGEAGVWMDRFLVPRGWDERSYRIDVFKRFSDGAVRAERAWYVLDDEAPLAVIRFDPGRAQLVVDTGAATVEISGVEIDAGKGRVLKLSPVGSLWAVPAAELPKRFEVLVRDRAGNRRRYAATLSEGKLEVRPVSAGGSPRAAARLPVGLRGIVAGVELAGEGGLRASGETVFFTRADGKEMRFPPVLRSLRLRSVLDTSDGSTLLGTADGDLVRVVCNRSGACDAKPLTDRFAYHPITGLVEVEGGKVLVGVLGEGLFELKGDRVSKSRLDVGSAFVTALVRKKDEVYVGTLYNGLWRVVRGRAVKTLLPHSQVISLELGSRGLVAGNGFGRFVERRRDDFMRVVDDAGPTPVIGTLAPRVEAGSRAVMAAVEWDGEVYLGGFDRGLLDARGEPVPMAGASRSAKDRQVNALLVADRALWMATEGGLFRVTRGTAGLEMARVLSGSAHDLAFDAERGLAVAASQGLFVIAADGSVAQVGGQGEGRRLFAVAWHEGRLWAGGMDGLFRATADGRLEAFGADRGFGSAWVTALYADGGALLAGTYDRGVFSVRAGRAAPVAGTEQQWVPFHAIRRIGGALWIGGLGMPPMVVGGGDARAVALPAPDTNDFAGVGGRVLALTSAGPAWVKAPSIAVAGRASGG